MSFRNKPALRGALVLLSSCIFVILSCNITKEEGHTYIQVRKDSAWKAFDSLEIIWKDTLSGAGGTLFAGNPADLAEVNKLLADGYKGQKIVITFKGYKDKTLAYMENRGFDGKDPGKVTKDIIPIAPIDTTRSVVGPKSPKLSRIIAAPDTVISIHDSVSFSATASLDSGSLKEYAWSYAGASGATEYGAAAALHGKSAGISGGHRYAEAGIYQVVLKVASDSDSIAIGRLNVQVLQDPPTADAGKDTAVYPLATVKLRGLGKDRLGSIVKTEWKIGNAGFFASAADTSFQAPASVQDLVIFFRVTDDDGQAVTDSLIVHVIPENESYLTALGVSQGVLAPQFAPGLQAYSDTVPNSVAGITFTPEGSGVIKVNDAIVPSGRASAAIDLAVGNNPVTVSVRFGATEGKTYSVNVYRRPASLNADLGGLSLSAGPIVSAFSPEIVVYTIGLPNASDSTLVTATAGNEGSTLTINTQPAVSGVGFPLKIPTGVSVITVVVTTREGAVKTYSIIVTRDKNGNADLSRLVPSADTLRPRFDRNTTAYTLAVENDVGAVTPFTLAPEMSAATSTYSLTVNGVVVDPSELASPIALRVGQNSLEIKVRAENGDSKTYGITVTRATNGNAALSALSVAPGSLDSAFSPGDTSYAVAIGNATMSITVTPTQAAPTSKITVNGKPVSGGAASEPIALNVGETVIHVKVTAENLATRTYLLLVTRAKSGNTELSGLVPSVGALAPAFKATIPDYAFQAAFADSLVRITPSAADSQATIQVNGVKVASGSASEYQKVAVGENPNRFIIVVTAENQAQKVYNVSVSRLPSSQSALKSLAVSHGPLVQKSALEYADTVSHGTANVTLLPQASDPNATLSVNSSPVANGSPSAPVPITVGDNTINCLVTAQDGKTQTLYVVKVTRLALLTRTRKLGSEVSVLDSAEVALGRAYATAAPSVTGFHFVNWSTVEGSAGFGDTAAAATTVTLSKGDARIQARYDTNTYTLAVTATNGTVARNPNLSAYNHGKSVILTVTPTAGFQFSSWSDGNTANPRTVAMTANTVLAASCTAIPTFDLTLVSNPTGSGSVAAEPAGPTYYTGTSVSLTPTPAPGYHFVNWTGGLTGNAVPGSLSMTADKTVTANFAPDKFTLTVTLPADLPSGCATTTPSGAVQVVNGAATAITATNCRRSVAGCPNGTVYLYYDFNGWSTVSGAPAIASPASATTTVTLGAGDATIMATYLAPRSQCE